MPRGNMSRISQNIFLFIAVFLVFAISVIHAAIPVVSSAVLNSTLGTNLSSENLTVYHTGFDSDSDPVTNITSWYLDGSSITNLYMPFEANNSQEATSTKDYSNHSNHGAVTGATWSSTAGYDGFGAYTFDGNGDYITITDSASVRPTIMTVSAWIKSVKNGDSVSIFQSFNYHDSWQHAGFELYKSAADKIYLEVGRNTGWTEGVDVGTAISTTAINDGNWHFIAGTYNGSHVKMYIDGVLENTASYTGGIAYHTTNYVEIGKFKYTLDSVDGYYWNGTIDDLRLYNRALSAEQILALYNNQTDTIVSNETNSDDIWQACITPNDGTSDGLEVCSNELAVVHECVVPVDDLEITHDTTLCGDTYAINDAGSTGVIRIATSDITLDCNGTTFDGNGAGTAIYITGSQTNVNITNCNITDYDYSIRPQTDWDYGWINNSNFSAIDYYLYLPAAVSNINIHNNRFSGDSSASTYMLYIEGSDYNTISNNTFNMTGSEDIGIYLHSGSNYNNITNNTINATSVTSNSYHALDIYAYGSTSNNIVWRNTFYSRGTTVTENWAGRTQTVFTTNTFCYDDGSGLTGNAYLNGAGYERPLQDCGPFPNINTLTVNQSNDNSWTWRGTDGDTVNINNIQDAVANIGSGNTVNVTTAGPYTASIYSWFRDNVTLDCNSIGVIDNDLTSSIGLGLSFVVNFTVQNCTFDDFGYSIYSYGNVYNSSILNNTISNYYYYGLYLYYADSNLIQDNYFGQADYDGYSQFYLQYSNYNVINNNTFKTTKGNGLYIYYTSSNYNNITNNTFNVTSSSNYHALNFDTYYALVNNIWKNTFYTRGTAVTGSWAGRTEGSSSNRFCVDDGSGLTGNAYLNGAGYERPLQDCGPFPNINTLTVNQSNDNSWTWRGTDGTTVNINNIQDAVANIGSGNTVNVTTAGPYTASIYSWFRDNVTLDCNSIGVIDNDLTSGYGLDLEFTNNFTMQNCTIDDFSYGIVLLCCITQRRKMATATHLFSPIVFQFT